MEKYTIGLDLGTLSGRAVLVSVADGAALATSEFVYPHGVMETQLPDGTPLGEDWALQHPQDYLEVLTHTIPDVLRQSGVAPKDIIGIGVDVTSSTILPITEDGTPLCFVEEYKGRPHAWTKLWKHHAAQWEANEITEIASQRQEQWLHRYGGKISYAWQLPKLWQILREDEEVYRAADYFIEAADWVVWALTGRLTKSEGVAGYKGLWHKKDGYPSPDFFAALDPRLETLLTDKMSYPMVPLGGQAGTLTEEMAAKTGLLAGTAVAASNIDAHVAFPALGVHETGAMLAIMGTSTCHLMNATTERPVPGICGVVEDGILPGFYGYEAGQNSVGDLFAWFIDTCIPAEYTKQAAGGNMHAFLREKASQLQVGESGLLALDWWNGNRSVLVDMDLTGLVLGMTLQTRPEEIYRALIEATAFGTRKIVETFRQAGIPVETFYASGGISQKDPMTMQIYADVLNMPIGIAGTEQGPALGCAIHAAVAAGPQRGGYATVVEASDAMGQLREHRYLPIAEQVAAYNQLYQEYERLHDYFGHEENNVMKRLKAMRAHAKGEHR